MPLDICEALLKYPSHDLWFQTHHPESHHPPSSDGTELYDRYSQQYSHQLRHDGQSASIAYLYDIDDFGIIDRQI